MLLCNLEGKLLISNCRKSEEDSSFSLMWFGLKKRKEVAVSAYYKPDFCGCSSAVAFCSGVGQGAKEKPGMLKLSLRSSSGVTPWHPPGVCAPGVRCSGGTGPVTLAL